MATTPISWITQPSGAFSPLNITGCVAWFDMQDATSFTNSAGFISAITNKASSVSWTEATNRPAYSATGFNSFPCMDFDGVNDIIQSTEAAVYNVFNAVTGYTIFYVANHDVADSSNAVFGCGNTGVVNTSHTKYWGTNVTGNGVYIAQARDAASAAINVESSGGLADINNNIFEWFQSGSAVSLKVNGLGKDPNIAAQALGVVSANASAIGARPSSVANAFHDGKVAEIIIYNSELSAANRTLVRNYLATKWSITTPAVITTPTSISGAVAWFDMQDAASYTQAGTVTSINNKISSVAWAAGANPPTYSASGINSFPCMDFDGVNDTIISSEAAVYSALANSSDYTIFFVANCDTQDRSEAIFGCGNSAVGAASLRYWGQSSSSTGRWISTTINDAVTTVNALNNVISDVNVNIFCWSSPGTTVSLNLNNAPAPNPSATAQNPGTLTLNQSALGSRPDSAADTFFDGKMGELIVYDRELTAMEKASVGAYLSLKWTITIA